MNSTFLILAQLDKSRELLNQATNGGGFSKSMDSLIILGFILLLAVALFCWAYFIRRRPNETENAHALVAPRRSQRSSRSRRESVSSKQGEGGRRRRRRRKQSEVRRNPTLEETGGLPPLRRAEGGSVNSSSAPPSL
jgi:hypothetical protein